MIALKQSQPLVENGDVEELLITEPDMKDAEERALLLNKNDFWDELQRHRIIKRRARLQQIIEQNPQYYEITGKFHKLFETYFRGLKLVSYETFETRNLPAIFSFKSKLYSPPIFQTQIAITA